MSCEMWRNMRCNDVPLAIIIVVHEEERTIEVFFDSIMLDKIFLTHGKDAVYFLSGYDERRIEKIEKKHSFVRAKEEMFFPLDTPKKEILEYYKKEKEHFEYYLNNDLNKRDVLIELNAILNILPLIFDKTHKENQLVIDGGFDEMYSTIKRMWNS